MSRKTSILGDAIRGGMAGGAATWVMDQVTTGMLQQQSAAESEREAAARPGGQSPDMNVVDRLGQRLGLDLDERTRSMAASLIHYGLGVVPGALYAVLHDRVPVLGGGRGLAYGLLLFLVNDELLGPAMGVAGPARAYPASSHARGLVGHAVLGVATDVAVAVGRR